jgi:cysteine synthase A
MPETMSRKRRKVLTILGANGILTPGTKEMKGAIEEAGRIAASHSNYFMPQQFKNPANPEILFKTTRPGIWEQTNGGTDLLLSVVGTGGTITGVSRYINAPCPEGTLER